MGYLETIGAKPCLHDQQEGYMEGIEGTVVCDHPCCPNYMESIEECDCANLEPEREKGYLGWFLNLAECLEAYPNPRKGFTFNNVETRSVWIYDGAHWRNTTQGNPFHLIYDIENAGEVKRGYAQSFYYVPTEEDVRGGTITFHFLIDGKDMWVECDVHYTSDIVLIEWNGSDFVSRVRSLDARAAYVEDGKVVDGSGNVVVNPAVIQSGLKVTVQYVPQSKSSDEQMQARKNIGAIGVSTTSNGTAVLESKGQTIYPYVPASKIPTTNGKSIEQRVADEESRAQGAEEELAKNLSILQSNTQSAASELDRRISEEQRRAESAEKGIEADLDALVNSTQMVVSSLRSRLLEEEERAQSAEKDIAEDLSSLSQDYGAFKNTLPDYIRERIEDVIGDIDINGEDGRVYVWDYADNLEVGSGAITGEITQEVLDALRKAQVVILRLSMDGMESVLVGNTKMLSDDVLYIVFDLHFVDKLVQYHFNIVGTTYSLVTMESHIITNAEWEDVNQEIDKIPVIEKLVNSHNKKLEFFAIEPVTVIVDGVVTECAANEVSTVFVGDKDFEIIPTSNSSIQCLLGYPIPLTWYDWLEGVDVFENIVFDMNNLDTYKHWIQYYQGEYHVQKAQYSNCIFWSDKPYTHSPFEERTNYTIYYSAELPMCYSTIPNNTYKPFYLAYGVKTDPNWNNPDYVNSYSIVSGATQTFSYYGATAIGIFDMAVDIIKLPKDCRGLMYHAPAITHAGVFDAINTTNFGAKKGSWQDAFGDCISLTSLYIKNLKTSINVSWSPINNESIEFMLNNAANTSAITISVSPYTWYRLTDEIRELAKSKNITLALISTNYADDSRWATKYEKPEYGIPKTDLDQEVNDILHAVEVADLPELKASVDGLVEITNDINIDISNLYDLIGDVNGVLETIING